MGTNWARAGCVALVLLLVPATAQAGSLDDVETALTRAAQLPVTCAPELAERAESGFYFYDPPAIWIRPSLCREIGRHLDGYVPRTNRQLLRAENAWHIFAHEVGHRNGYLHCGNPRPDGTVERWGADAEGERVDRLLMRRAGLPRTVARRIDRASSWSCLL